MLSPSIPAAPLFCGTKIWTAEQVPEQYLDDLRGKGISYMVAGSSAVDLEKIVESLYRDFGINTLLLEGGGKINGAFLQAGLLDEVSLLLAPGIDGRDGIPTLLDGRNGEAGPAIPLRLRSVQELKSGILWIRYDVANNAANV